MEVHLLLGWASKKTEYALVGVLTRHKSIDYVCMSSCYCEAGPLFVAVVVASAFLFWYCLELGVVFSLVFQCQPKTQSSSQVYLLIFLVV